VRVVKIRIAEICQRWMDLPCRWVSAVSGGGAGRCAERIRTPGTTGVEGAGGPGCGARGWWRGLALVSVGGGENCLKQMSHVI